MQLIRHHQIEDILLPVFNRGCVLAIGNFDGVHLGHQAILRQLLAKADQFSLPSVVMSFSPLPHDYFARHHAVPRLSFFRDKFDDLRQLGIDHYLLIKFDQNFAKLSHQDFVKDYLQHRLNVRCIVVGEDFRFGDQRQGDLAYLQQALPTVELNVLAPVTLNQQRISSTNLRQFLLQGDLNSAALALGHPYRLSGRVGHGYKLGRRLGFPTANIRLSRMCPALSGIFAVKVSGAGMTGHVGAAYISDQPKEDGYYLLEVFLLDRTQDLYGQHLQVEFLAKIREVKHNIDSLEALKQQIASDVEAVKVFFRHY